MYSIYMNIFVYVKTVTTSHNYIFIYWIAQKYGELDQLKHTYRILQKLCY